MAYDESKLINLGHLKEAIEVVKEHIPEDTDTKVTQTIVSDNVERPILTTPTAQSATTTTTAAFSTKVKVNASTGNLTATKFTGDGSGLNVGTASGNAVYTTTSGKLASGSLSTTDPTIGNSPSLDFIATISQDAKGKITATKQTVKDMVGSNGTDAGTHGLVPSPSVSDNTKFLKGDGTWATPTNTDTKVTQTVKTDDVERPILTAPTTQTTTTTTTSVFSTNIKANASTGTLTATKFVGDGSGLNVGSTSGNAVYTTTSGKLTSGSLSTSDPSASGNTTSFIDTISQDAKGKITATKKTVPNMGAATSSAAGTKGLVQATAGSQTKFLRGDATWQTVITTETQLSKGTPTGSGNAVTDINVSNHQITLVKGTTFATKAELDALGNPMNFKGTVGTGGTVTTLPADAKIGDTYKVITAGTYGGNVCKVGDTLICTVAGSSQTWVMIPSGDEPSGTVTNVATGTGLTGGPITGSGTVKANLVSETKLTNAAVAATETAGRVYPVAVDNNGKLAVNVPWVDTDTKYTATKGTIGSASAGTAISADDITGWTTNTKPSLTYESKSVGSASGWSAGTQASLTYAAETVGSASGWSAGTAASASVSNGVLTISNGVAPSLTITDKSPSKITGWTTNTKPSLTITSVSCDDITDWDAGTQASLSYTARSIPNISVTSTSVVTDVTPN